MKDNNSQKIKVPRYKVSKQHKDQDQDQDQGQDLYTDQYKLNKIREILGEDFLEKTNSLNSLNEEAASEYEFPNENTISEYKIPQFPAKDLQEYVTYINQLSDMVNNFAPQNSKVHLDEFYFNQEEDKEKEYNGEYNKDYNSRFSHKMEEELKKELEKEQVKISIAKEILEELSN